MKTVMKNALSAALFPALFASVGATALPAAAADFTPKTTLQSYFALEGKTPYPTPYAGTLNFSALESKYASPNGHGYRNELKIAEKKRLSAAKTLEHFKARITPTLSNGAKTIVAQYHVVGTDTILKVYVQDTADRSGLDKIAGNGIFDILVRILGTNNEEATTALGTVHSGEAFDLDIVFRAGKAQVSATTAAHGALQTPLTEIKPDERAIYFKFGDYLQARDPVTGEHTSDPAKWDQYYSDNHIDTDRVSFSQTVFEREAAQP
jgi:hypothetical protein